MYCTVFCISTVNSCTLVEPVVTGFDIECHFVTGYSFKWLKHSRIRKHLLCIVSAFVFPPIYGNYAHTAHFNACMYDACQPKKRIFLATNFLAKQ